jgi:hypothetical protein
MQRFLKAICDGEDDPIKTASATTTVLVQVHGQQYGVDILY